MPLATVSYGTPPGSTLVGAPLEADTTTGSLSSSLPITPLPVRDRLAETQNEKNGPCNCFFHCLNGIWNCLTHFFRILFCKPQPTKETERVPEERGGSPAIPSPAILRSSLDKSRAGTEEAKQEESDKPDSLDTSHALRTPFMSGSASTASAVEKIPSIDSDDDEPVLSADEIRKDQIKWCIPQMIDRLHEIRKRSALGVDRDSFDRWIKPTTVRLYVTQVIELTQRNQDQQQVEGYLLELESQCIAAEIPPRLCLKFMAYVTQQLSKGAKWFNPNLFLLKLNTSFFIASAKYFTPDKFYNYSHTRNPFKKVFEIIEETYMCINADTPPEARTQFTRGQSVAFLQHFTTVNLQTFKLYNVSKFGEKEREFFKDFCDALEQPDSDRAMNLFAKS